MNKKLIKENLEFLVSLENYFYTVTYSHYCRNLLRKDIDKLKDFYEKYTGKVRSGFNPNCSRCIYSLVEDVAKIYYEYKNTEKPKIGKNNKSS